MKNSYDNEDEDFLPSESPVAVTFQRENVLRPQYLEDFQGQRQLKENLGVFIKAARDRGEALDHTFLIGPPGLGKTTLASIIDHTFLIGPPGLGKTTLASIIANEMHSELRMTSAPALEKPKDLAGILTNVTENSIFFIDEIHRLRPALEEMLYIAMEDFEIDWVIGQGPSARTMSEIHRLRPALEEMLYIAMEDFEIDWVIGQGPSARTMRIPLPRFTLIGATTKAGAVSTPLSERFGITGHLEYYDADELKSIILRSAGILECRITDEGASPRIANRLLKRLRDFADVMKGGVIDTDIVRFGLEKLGIDDNGLEKQDRAILRTIIEYYQGGPVGADTLSISVGEAVETLEDFYEPYLIQQGYLKRTPRGRMVTPKAYELLGMKCERGADYADQGLLF